MRSIVEAAAKELPEATRDQAALKVALKKRDDKAREYFNQLAGKFGRAYCPGRTWDGVAHMLFALVPSMVIADLGAGEGTLAQLLAKRAKKVIAIDNSEKMVEFGSTLAKKHGFKNLEYRFGEIEEPPIPANSVDLALLSQALHHAANPQRAIARRASHPEKRRAHRGAGFCLPTNSKKRGKCTPTAGSALARPISSSSWRPRASARSRFRSFRARRSRRISRPSSPLA